MGLFHDEDFWEVLSSIRTMFVTGRLGSGKTLLSFAAGQRAIGIKMSRGVMANINHRFRRLDTVANAMCVIDEAWQIMDNRYSVDNFSFYGAWSRKTNTVWAFPSVYGVDKRVRGLQVERVVDVAILPVRIWVYRYFSADGRKGWFGLSYPERFFGTYATKQAPLNDGGALDSLMSLLPEGIELVQRGRGKGRVWKTPGSDEKARSGVAELQGTVRAILDRLLALEGGGVASDAVIARVVERVSGEVALETEWGAVINEIMVRLGEIESRVNSLQIAGVGEDGNRWG